MPYLQKQNPHKGIYENKNDVLSIVLPYVQEWNISGCWKSECNGYQRAGRLDAEPITCEKITVIGFTHFKRTAMEYIRFPSLF